MQIWYIMFNVTQKEDLVFNSTKCAIKQESVTFFGGMFSQPKATRLNPGKIQGISDMPAPQTQAKITVFSRCSQLPADIHAASESPHGTGSESC